MKLTTSTLVTGFVVGQAAATGWNSQPKFNCPSQSNNQCNDQQKTGFDWSSLATGNFNTYANFGFSGFTCANKFGKRDALTKRTFQSKCITGNLKAAGSSGPSFDCKNKEGFSIDKYQISVDHDTDVEFHYKMDDGSVCKHTAPCKAGGSIVQNTQCGGARQVSLQLPKTASKDCGVGVHSVAFKCNSVSTSSTSSTSTYVTKSTSVPVVIKSSSSAVTTSTSSSWTKSSSIPIVIKSSSTYSVTRETSTSVSSVVRFTSIPESSSTSTWSSSKFYSNTTTPSATSVAPVTPSSSKSSYSLPSFSLVQSSSKVVAIPSTSSWTTSYSTMSSSSTEISPVTPSSSTSSSYSSSWSSSWSSSSSSIYSSASISSVVRPVPPQPTAQCPDVLPKCLNTWLHDSGCKDNTDKDCFCKQQDFTKNVMGCVNSWSADDQEVQRALSYLVGICAKWVPENPGLVTNCPKSITIAPPAPTAVHSVVTSNAPAAPIETPKTTVLVISTISVCPPGKPFTISKNVVTSYSTPVTSTIYTTTTSTLPCPKCAEHASITAPAKPVDVPVTTITISAKYTAPCTYSTGESAGFPIPGSSTVTFVQQTVTAPQVAFMTANPVQGNVNVQDGESVAEPSVDLVAAATPAPEGAAYTMAPDVTATITDASAVTATESLSTSYTAMYTGASTDAPVMFQGAATSNKAFGGLVAFVAGVAAFLF